MDKIRLETTNGPHPPVQTPAPSPAQDRSPASLGQTGPKLLCGKAFSSQNAITHGLRSEAILISRGSAAESPAEFDAFLAEMNEIYMPVGKRQHDLVQTIAMGNWWLRRSQRFEIAAIHDNIKSFEEAARRDAADAEAGRQKKIDEAGGETGEATAFLRHLRENPDCDPLDHNLTFDLAPAITAIAETHNRILYEFLFEDNDVDSFRQYLEELGIKGVPAVREAFDAALQRVIAEHSSRAAELQAQAPQPPVSDDAALLGLLPTPDKLKLLIRYRTMITRDRDRALMELNRVQAEPPRATSPGPVETASPQGDQRRETSAPSETKRP